MKNKFKSEKRAKHPEPDLISLGIVAQLDPRSMGLAGQPNPRSMGLANIFLKCFGSAWPATPIAITPFGSVSGLAWQPDPTTFGFVAKPEPSAFDREGNTPRCAGCKTARLGLQSGAPVWP
jgi:hypothetical protein